MEVDTTQHTPNPAAQFPAADPPAVVHSEAVRQVPIVVVELLLVHSSLGNCTTLNRESCSTNIKYDYDSNFCQLFLNH